MKLYKVEDNDVVQKNFSQNSIKLAHISQFQVKKKVQSYTKGNFRKSAKKFNFEQKAKIKSNFN